MLNSKEILEQTGISRATLNNYIGWGIVPRPEVLPPEPQDGGAPRLGYFPDQTIQRIAQIRRLKKEGWSMPRIAEYFGGKAPATPPTEPTPITSALPGPNTTGRAPPPLLTDVAVLVAGLQHSSSICAELPPEDYFLLINQIWAAVDPIFRRHSGTHGKHPSDGMVGYFFPLPVGSYLWNALVAAHEIRDAMRGINKDWQLRKGWGTELYINIGLDQGQEWLGTFKSPNNAEFTAFAETISQAALISDFSRFGAVWATKNLVGKLSSEERQRLRYGVRRRTQDGEHVFIPSIFSDVQRPSFLAAGGTEKPREILLLPITEIVDIPPSERRQAP